ncbi:MAG TPA: DoxX family membrane protein [Candidatus Eremiobacteraceae bacterium]|nr:DoxX family membrane protein [Candidatus Eremiobacteraceae bacterium]
MLPASSRYAAVLAALRIYTGIAWLDHGIGKLTSNFAGALPNMLQGMSNGTSGVYHDFIVNTVIPNSSTFALLVSWGETLAGASLLLGLFTRLGGIAGAFLPLNYWAAKGAFAHLDGYFGMDLAYVVLSLVSVALPTGLVLGIDGLIAARKRPAAVGKKSAP